MSKQKLAHSEPHWMLWLTPLAFLTGSYAYFLNFFILAYSEWTVFLTSILYWMKPVNNYRRKIDIIVVQLAFYIHLYYVFTYICYTGLFLYKFGILFYIIGLFFESNIFHALLWICGSIGNFVLITHYQQLNTILNIF